MAREIDSLRLTQLARLLGFADVQDVDEARRLVAEHPDIVARGLVAEAADSDDVTSAETALDYLELRLGHLQDYLPPGTEAVIRTEFARAIASWS